jgi:hypothetical protein
MAAKPRFDPPLLDGMLYLPSDCFRSQPDNAVRQRQFTMLIEVNELPFVANFCG